MAETFKQEQKKSSGEEIQKKTFLHLLDEDEVEIQRLTSENIEDSVKVMRKCAFDVTEKEVGTIVAYEKSFAATVNRMIVGVGLAWPAHLDFENKKITAGSPNALYLEDPAVLLAYEGRGIRRILLKERERESLDSGFSYSIAYLSQDIPKGDTAEHIREGGSTLEKLYLSEEYEFYKSDRGILAIKRLK